MPTTPEQLDLLTETVGDLVEVVTVTRELIESVAPASQAALNAAEQVAEGLVTYETDEFPKANKASAQSGVGTGLLTAVTGQQAIDARFGFPLSADRTGVTNATSIIQAGIDEATGLKVPYKFPSGTFLVGALVIPANAVLEFDNTVLKAATGINDDTGILNILNVDNVTLKGTLELDLNLNCHRGINSQYATNFKQTGYIKGHTPKRGGNNFNAVFMFNGGEYEIDRLYAYDYKKNADDTGGIDSLYGGVRAPNCTKFFFNSIECDTGNQAVNFNAANNIRGNRIIARNITDNGIYIIGNCYNIRLGLLDVEGGEEVCVLDSSVADANVIIDTVIARNAAKSVNLRMGGGYRIGMLEAYNAYIAQSLDLVAYPGVTSLRIDQARITSTTISRPITLTQDTNISFGSVEITAMNLGVSDSPIRLDGAWDKISFETLKVSTNPASNNRCIKIGSNAGVIPAPSLNIGRVVRVGPTDVLDISLVTNENCVNIQFYDTLMGHSGSRFGATVKSGTAEMELRSVATNEALNDIISRINFWSGDTSITDVNLRRIFSILTKTTNATGNQHETDFLDDLGNAIARIKTAGKGMTIKLPTSPLDVEDGQLWNYNNKPSIRGSNFAANSGFNDGTIWSLGADWTIASGVATKVAGSGTNGISQTVTLVAGRLYLVTWDVIGPVAGSGTYARLSGGTNMDGAAQSSAAGSKSTLLTAVAGNTAFAIMGGSSTSCSVDNLRIAEVSQ